jgi:hypothetical protein
VAVLVLSYHNVRPPTGESFSSFEAPITFDDSSISFNISDSVIVGKEYSARACSLEPAWGMVHRATDNVCIGTDLKYPNTTATQLSCRDKPINIGRSHDDGLTIALLYFAKPSMLLSQLENFASYPVELQQQLTVLIVDDGSPEGLRATDYISTTEYVSHFRLRLTRITTEKAWNIGGARNLAFYLADTQRVLLLDLDMMVPVETMHKALTWQTRNQTHIMAHRFNRRKPDGRTSEHPAVALLDVDAYWESGGCDEDFCGRYAFTDVHFWFRWRNDTSRLRLDHYDTYIVEFNHNACNSTFLATKAQQRCEEARMALQKPSREKESNAKIFKRKKTKGCWSNRYLRFRWILEI